MATLGRLNQLNFELASFTISIRCKLAISAVIPSPPSCRRSLAHIQLDDLLLVCKLTCCESSGSAYRGIAMFKPLHFLLASTLFLSCHASFAEPPSRVARLAHVNGSVSFSLGGQQDWLQAAVNRPLTTGDSLWADADGRAEMQVGGSSIRLDAQTSVTLLNLDDSIVQLQLTQGSLQVNIRQLERGQSIEVDTPNLAYTLSQAGEYRISVAVDGTVTSVMVQTGAAQVYDEGASYAVNVAQGYRFYGTGLADYESLPTRQLDELDRWSRERELRLTSSSSARYVSTNMVGYEDLDAHGSWRQEANLGNVWIPRHVARDWSPYRDGHWSWVAPWGWT